MSDPSITRATAAEAEIVGRLIHALLFELGGVAKGPDLDWVLRSAERVLAEDTVVALIAWVDGTPAGVLVLNECAAIYAGGRFGEISELYVTPENRSRGVAPHLLEAALAEAAARGWSRVEVGAPNQPEWDRTLQFYLRNGFDEIGPRLRRHV